MFTDDCMKDMLLNPDLYGLEDDDEEENCNKKDDFDDDEDVEEY